MPTAITHTISEPYETTNGTPLADEVAAATRAVVLSDALSPFQPWVDRPSTVLTGYRDPHTALHVALESAGHRVVETKTFEAEYTGGIVEMDVHESHYSIGYAEIIAVITVFSSTDPRQMDDDEVRRIADQVQAQLTALPRRWGHLEAFHGIYIILTKKTEAAAPTTSSTS